MHPSAIDVQTVKKKKGAAKQDQVDSGQEYQLAVEDEDDDDVDAEGEGKISLTIKSPREAAAARLSLVRSTSLTRKTVVV